MNEIVAHAGKLAATSDAQSDAVVSIRGVSKTYASGLQALKPIDLDIRRGEIFALLGPNGAGKTTLISIICGIVTATTGKITVDGLDIQKDFRAARSRIGLVPQELATDRFEFGLGDGHIQPRAVRTRSERVPTWSRFCATSRSGKSGRIPSRALSGGMKRRVMIAKALSHEPRILFLDEPTAGVDVELRRDMWALVRRLRDGGVTVILTTHYIDEAEEMADRIGVIRKGELIVVEDKATLMKKLGSKRLTLVAAGAA